KGGGVVEARPTRTNDKSARFRIFALPQENSHEFDSRARERAGREAFRRQGDPGFRAGRHGPRQRQSGRGRPHPHPGLRGRLHRPRGRGPQREFHRAQDFLWRRRGARLSALFADDRLDQARAPRQGAPRQALLPARSPRQGRAHRREAGSPRRRRGRRGGGEGRRVISGAPRARRRDVTAASEAPRARADNTGGYSSSTVAKSAGRITSSKAGTQKGISSSDQFFLTSAFVSVDNRERVLTPLQNTFETGE